MSLRLAIAEVKPDVLFLFTDPRFFVWVWEMEDEIHDVCPIAYNHVWDEEPYPDYNDAFYEATDLINCISWKTYSLVQPHHPNKTNYVPHALYDNVFKPLPQYEVDAYKRQILGDDRADHFVAFWNSRNARRKRPGDLLYSWRLFIDKLQKEHGNQKATFIMHTDPLDNEGPNLYKVIELLKLENNVMLSKEKLEFDKMNILYNIADVTLSASCAEGFGLSTLESLYACTPIIVTKTGGLTTQVINRQTGEEYGIGLDPDIRSLVGSQSTPHIFEDLTNNEKFADAIYKMFSKSRAERREIGSRGRQYALQEFNMRNLIETWDRTLTETIANFKKNKHLPRYKLMEL